MQLSYAIGVSQPTSINIDCFGTNKIPEEKISQLVFDNFDLRPKAIIENLDLKKPIFKKTAAYGHFGRTDENFSWERLDKVDVLKQALNGVDVNDNSENEFSRGETLEKIGFSAGIDADSEKERMHY